MHVQTRPCLLTPHVEPSLALSLAGVQSHTCTAQANTTAVCLHLKLLHTSAKVGKLKMLHVTNFVRQPQTKACRYTADCQGHKSFCVKGLTVASRPLGVRWAMEDETWHTHTHTLVHGVLLCLAY